MFSVNAECTSDYALYSATFSADRITDILSLLAECAGAESFPEEDSFDVNINIQSPQKFIEIIQK